MRGIFSFKIYLLTVIGFLLFSCAPTRNVKPLKKNEQQVSGSFGGPVIQFGGLWIPIPYTSVAYSRGISDGFTAYGALHTTAALFGDLQTEAGGSFWMLKPDSGRFSLSGNVSLQMAGNVAAKQYRLWPQLEINGIYDYGSKGHFLYAGLGSRIETDYFGQRPNGHSPLIPFINLGITWLRSKWQFQLELKLLAPAMVKDNLVADIPRIPGNPGAPGIYFGFTRKL